MMNYDCDHGLFLALNFDGGAVMDRAMLAVSGTTMWLPLYALILWLVYRRMGWRNVILFVSCLVAALALADMVAGIFKHVGLLKNLWSDFPPRLRPMFTPELEGLVHFPPEAVAGRYGTVSSHAAVIVALTTLSAAVISRRWFSWMMIVCTLLICYSRIYLAKHFPIDLVLGAGVGVVTGCAMLYIYRLFDRRWLAHFRKS
ncbi:MAG: phosphatase PAP2 family protein [Alistipes sp.]